MCAIQGQQNGDVPAGQLEDLENDFKKRMAGYSHSSKHVHQHHSYAVLPPLPTLRVPFCLSFTAARLEVSLKSPEHSSRSGAVTGFGCVFL